MTDDPFDDVRLTAMGLLIEVTDGLMPKLDAVHARRGLSGSDFDTLVRLARSPHGRLRMSDLAAQTAMSTSGITRVVDRMERAGLVAREARPGDRRSSDAVLTAAGRQRLLADLPELLDTIDDWFTGHLDAAELDALLAALHTLRDVVRPAAAAGAPANASRGR